MAQSLMARMAIMKCCGADERVNHKKDGRHVLSPQPLYLNPNT